MHNDPIYLLDPVLHFLASLWPDRRRFQPVNFTVWRMLLLLATTAHRPQISPAAETHCPSARLGQKVAAILDPLRAAKRRFRDTASVSHCSRTPHPSGMPPG